MGFNKTALRATQPKLHSMFCALFLMIALSAAELMSFGHLGSDLTPLDYYLWGTVKDECYADKPETIDALKEIFVQPLVKYRFTQSIMCLKIGPIV